MLAHCVHCVYSGNRIRWTLPMLFSEFLVFLIRIVFSIVLPRDENRGGLFMFAEPLCCSYTGNRIRPFCFAPVIGFMGANPYVQKPMVGLSVYNGQYRVRSVVYPLWCRVLPHGSATPQGVLCVVRLSVVWWLVLGKFQAVSPVVSLFL